MKKLIEALPFLFFLVLMAVFILIPDGEAEDTTLDDAGRQSVEEAYTEEEPEEYIDWDEAKQYIGETVTVKGFVESSAYFPESEGKPIILNVGRDYPDPDRFQVVLSDAVQEDLQLEAPEFFDGELITAYGKVSEYDGVAQIVLESMYDIDIL